MTVGEALKKTALDLRLQAIDRADDLSNACWVVEPSAWMALRHHEDGDISISPNGSHPDTMLGIPVRIAKPGAYPAIDLVFD